MAFNINSTQIGIIGLGYVGLPLAVEFGKTLTVFGFDIDSTRIDELKAKVDKTLESSPEQMDAARYLSYTTSIKDLEDCNIFIITVPTPVDENNKPDLSPMILASELVGSVLKPNDIVIYESTVFPGATEDICAPVLERISGLEYSTEKLPYASKVFYLGYSPERINPGDKKHKLTDIVKITSGSTPEVAEFVDQLYRSIIEAGTYQAKSIKVAEAAKVIENTQRDVNIALINELAMLFDRLELDTEAVLEAAGTKWNFFAF